MSGKQPKMSEAAIDKKAQELQDSFNSMHDSFKVMPHSIVSALKQADFIQDIAGIRAQIIANATVLYPINSTVKSAYEPPSVIVPEFFVVTSGSENAIQAAVLQRRGGAVNFGAVNHSINKDVLIKGPTATTTGKALEALLQYTNTLMSEKWGECMTVPMGYNAVSGANGSVHYRKA